ncbi:E3 ubiquitin-protein ligase PUB23 [Acorus calamus]|uniref:U-box domain-containing protein n=1 Tax=Acorus calamus TaxID=4465 RepID=A0AAV9DRJ2_ACOCL|nr:E3 ubiquitin-protein ligase PUB23 [Acorus calamus]
MEVPDFFRCPISMELMKDPVTIPTGVTYDRRSIEKWFFVYKKSTCPATGQTVVSTSDITPNHTLRRLITAWIEDLGRTPSAASSPPSTSASAAVNKDDLASLLTAIDSSSPFKVGSLKKLRAAVESGGGNARADFVSLGGIETLRRIVIQVLLDSADSSIMHACEHALAILTHHLPLPEDALTEPDLIKSMLTVLQRGSAESRLHVLTIFRSAVKSSNHKWTSIITDNDIDITKSLLDLLSDEVSTAKSSSYALDVLIAVLGRRHSKKNRLKAVEAGAVHVLVELLIDCPSRHRCEKALFALKLLCECAEGRSAFADHAVAVAAVAKVVLRVSDAATKLSVKVLWLVCGGGGRGAAERVLEEMVMCGAVKKLLGVLHVDGRSSTKEKAMRMIRLHGGVWRRYPCCPSELRGYLDYVNSSDSRLH